MPPTIPYERVTKSDYFQSIRGLEFLADSAPGLCFAVGPIPSPCIAPDVMGAWRSTLFF